MQDHLSHRGRIAGPYLSGRGVEIGAGVAPHPLPDGAVCTYIDKRPRAELAALFGAPPPYEPVSMAQAGSGHDFLIAHHVLEHFADPIGALISWHTLVCDGGVCVISLPDMAACADAARVPPSLEHLLLDYLLERGEQSFESKEHIYSFLLGWRDDTWFGDYSAPAFATNVQAEANRDLGHDLHWHAFTPALASLVITAALRLGGRGAKLLAYSDSGSTPPTPGEALLVYRLGDKMEGFAHDAEPDIAALGEMLRKANVRLGQVR